MCLRSGEKLNGLGTQICVLGSLSFQVRQLALDILLLVLMEQEVPSCLHNWLRSHLLWVPP